MRANVRVFILLFSLLLLTSWGGWRSPGSHWGLGAAQVSSPEGCEGVFAQTTRGGARAEPGPGGFACSLGQRRKPGTYVQVTRVIDGDTIVVTGGARVRYIGIDTPELGGQRDAPGRQARDANRDLVSGQEVRLEREISNTDRFNRLLRYVYVGEVLVEAELVREGWARAVAYPPDTRYHRCYQALEAEAQAEKRGIWAEEETSGGS